MIVPRQKLIVWSAIFFLPSGLLLAVLPELAFPVLLFCAAFVAFVLFDVVSSLGVLDGISLEFPATVNLSRDREGEIPVTIHNEPETEREIHIGLNFPSDLQTKEHTTKLQLPAEKAKARYRWNCTARRRGRFHFDRYYLEASSRFGFWDRRLAVPTEVEIRVYPNLLRDSKNLAALFLNSAGIGIHKQRLIGKGREFEKLREYLPGDSYEDIHWKASAKRGLPVTKIYQTERTQEVYVLIDASRLSARPAEPDNPDSNETQLERFVNAALIMGLAAAKQGDNFGVLVFSDRVHTFVRARNGAAHYGICRDALYTLEPRIVSPDYEELCRFVRVRMTRRVLLIVLTSLDDPVLAESYERNVKLISRQHLVFTTMIVPQDCRPLFSSPEVYQLDQIYRALGGHQKWHDLQELERVLKRAGVDMALVNEEALSNEVVSQYMAVKQRQIL